MDAFMNGALGAGLLSIAMLLLLSVYMIKLRLNSRKPQIISQAMLQHRFSSVNKYSRKFNTKSQSKNHEKETNVRVIIVDGQAYWIKDNIFYNAPLLNDMVDKESAQRVDTTNMDKVQLDQMLFILDKLREGISDDSRGSRDT
jgi:hypothetical protein